MKAAFKTVLVAALCLMLWPALAGAAPPEPKGKLVFQDDFSDPKKSGLEDKLQATDYSRGFHAPGVYHLKDLKAGETHWSLFPNQSYGAMSFELDLWDNSDNFKGDLSEGVIVRAQDDTHFYAVMLDPRKGQYAVRKLNGKDTWSDLVAWKASSLIKQQEGVNHLRIDADGSSFTLYLNGDSLGSFSDSSYAKGSVGLIASNVDATGNHLHFDNVKIYSSEAAATPSTSQPSDLPKTSAAEGGSSLILAGFALALLALGMLLRRKLS